MTERKPQSNWEDIDELIVALRDGALNSAQKERLESWAASGKNNRNIIELLDGGSQMGPDIARMMSYDQERVWKAIVAADRRRSRRRAMRRWLSAGAAACVVAAAVLSGLWRSGDSAFENISRSGSAGAVLELAGGERLDVSNLKTVIAASDSAAVIEIDPGVAEFRPSGSADALSPMLNTLTVPEGSDYKLVLSDGTTVWVNSGSKLVFPSAFHGNTREVEVEGECYFEVTRDASKPFVVNAGGQKVTVLGTSFNVSAYKDDGYVETTLVSGSVSIAVDDRTALLRPGQQARYDPQANTVKIVDVESAEAYASWTRGIFSFVDEPLESICRKLSRSYGIEFRIVSPSPDTIHYSGVVRRYESFAELAKIMESTGEISFGMRDGVVIVTPTLY